MERGKVRKKDPSSEETARMGRRITMEKGPGEVKAKEQDFVNLPIAVFQKAGGKKAKQLKRHQVEVGTLLWRSERHRVLVGSRMEEGKVEGCFRGRGKEGGPSKKAKG